MTSFRRYSTPASMLVAPRNVKSRLCIVTSRVRMPTRPVRGLIGSSCGWYTPCRRRGGVVAARSRPPSPVASGLGHPERPADHQRRLALGTLGDGCRRHQRRPVEGAGELVQIPPTRPRGASRARRRSPRRAGGRARPSRCRRAATRRDPSAAGRSRVGRDVRRAVELTEVGLPALFCQRPVPQRRVDELLHGRRREAVVELGDLQHLEAEGGTAEVTGQQGHGGRQATPRTRSHDGHPVAVDAQRAGFGMQPGQRGVAVVQCRPGTGARGRGGSRPRRPRRRRRRPSVPHRCAPPRRSR